MSIPELALFSDYKPENYIDSIYEIFRADLVMSHLEFINLPITYPWHPPFDNKHFCFWHLITNKFESQKEEDRRPDIRRCERVRWISYVIRNANNREKIWCWEKEVRTKRGRSKHIALYLHEECYLVVLRRKPKRLELVTAYVKENHSSMVREKDLYSNDPREE